VKVLFAGDLSFAWGPKPGLAGRIQNALSFGLHRDKELMSELDRACGLSGIEAMLKKAEIRLQAERMAAGLRDRIAETDLFCVNLECALSGRGEALEEKRFKLKALPHYFHALKELNVGAVCLANNHILDFGPDGLADTVGLLERTGIPYCGLRRNEERLQKPLILRRGTEEVALLNYVAPEIIDPDPELFFRHDPCPFPLIPENVLGDIEEHSAKTPVVVVLHWGEEWSFLESEKMISFARQCIENGASAVVSHHTHLPGGIEEYKGRPISYGLGNLFMSLPPFSGRRAFRRLLMQLEFSGGKLTGYEFIPVISDIDGYPVISPVFKIESFSEGYFPAGFVSSSAPVFDSLNEFHKASAMIRTDGREEMLEWKNDYLNLFEIIQGKLPIAPGWRRTDGSWNGIACSRELMGGEYAQTNIIHMSGDVEIEIRFNPALNCSKYKLLLGYPQWFRPREEFAIPELALSSGAQKVFQLNRNLPDLDWKIIELEMPANSGGDIVLRFKGSKDKFSYLAWRLLGF